ncbi:MAG: lamin tail domain-containing protein [Halobacteria archaeon]|nr:lamin tail domain-containing protein [Halobacteria archaeon]
MHEYTTVVSYFEKSSSTSRAKLSLKKPGCGIAVRQDKGNTSTGSYGIDIKSLHVDAEGNDHENLNDEYIVFENTGSESLDLSRWTVTDEAGHRYTIPSGVSLGSGESLTLRTGNGKDSGDELYWGADSAIWNNGGDTVILRNNSGSVVLREDYS